MEVVCSHGRKCVLSICFSDIANFNLYEIWGFIISAPRKISVRSGIWCASGIAGGYLAVGAVIVFIALLACTARMFNQVRLGKLFSE